jgi:NADPH-dependent 2,4-dienoyl-CoA reductase/sulfur reductase-like enzyme
MNKLYDVLVIGAGPAGLAAAHAAASHGATVGIIDDNPQAGGQIWRGAFAPRRPAADPRARQLWHELQAAANVTFMHQSRVLYAPAPGQLCVQTPTDAMTLYYQRLIIATGARELLLPFPGWTLPGVTGAGGLQALVKGGYPAAGKRVVVAGSGPLLLAVAATLNEQGAEVVAIIEQAGTARLARFAAGLSATPSKLLQALQLAKRLRSIPYYRDSIVRAAHGTDTLRQVEVRRAGATFTLDCDYLACGYGLLPNVELAMALGCAISAPDTPDAGAPLPPQAVIVDTFQRTSIDGLYCAGEGTGIGGVDKALVEGRIAGLSAAGRRDLAQIHFRERARWHTFASRLEQAFALRPDIATLPSDDTIVCRCEDVRHGELREHASWRSAKLHTRCGMGPCQGRICGGATGVLYGWRPTTVRVPLAPARIDSIIHP